MNSLHIFETSEKDLNHIVSLWNDGDVMFYVGFPNGLGVTAQGLKSNWLPRVNINPLRKHYSIYHDEIGYCGESYYEVFEDNSCALDIKLFPYARGKGIAYQSLKHAMIHAFLDGKADYVYVDPHKDNQKAISLYERLGFEYKIHPQEKYRDTHVYLEFHQDKIKKLLDHTM